MTKRIRAILITSITPWAEDACNLYITVENIKELIKIAQDYNAPLLVRRSHYTTVYSVIAGSNVYEYYYTRKQKQ